MEFVIPGFLAALGAAAIPLVLHLVFRRRLAEVVFPTARFIKIASVRTSRRRRFENLLLFVLRTLLLTLLALGLAGPVLKRATAGHGARDVAIIIDNSPSMAARDEGRPRFARAKAAAEEILQRLEKSDLVTLLPTSPPASLEEAAPSADLSEIRTRLAMLSVSAARGSLAAAIERAAAVMAESTAPERLLFIVSDQQANSFPAAGVLSDKCRLLLLETPVILYDCSAGPLRNVAVESIDVRSTGIVASPVEVTATIVSRAPVEETLSATLIVSGVTAGVRSATVPAGGAAEVTFQTVVESPGVFEGVVAVAANDAFAEDDRRHFALVARERVKTLLVARENVEPAFRDDLFFLSRAMDPFRGREDGSRSSFEISTGTYGEIESFDGFDLVVLVMREGVEALWTPLERFVRGGGSVILFAAYDEETAAAQPEWLPATLLGKAVADRAGGEAFSIASIDAGSPAMAAFAEEPPALYNAVAVYEYWMCNPRNDAVVLAGLDTGLPVIVEGGFGGGRVVLFATAPLVRMTTLASSQFFLPLLHEVSFHLVSATRGAKDITAGDPAVLAAPASGGLPAVTNPAGATRVVDQAAAGAFPYADTWEYGCYRVSDSGGAEMSAFSVNLDPAESDLRTLDAAGGGEVLPARKVLAADSTDALDEALSSLVANLALGEAVLYIVLFIAILEVIAANRPRAGVLGKG